MEAKAAVFRQESIINSAFLFAGGYVRALSESNTGLSDAQLATLRQLLERVVDNSGQIAKDIRTVVERAQERNTDEQLRALVLKIRQGAENLRLFGELRPVILRSSPELADYWTEDRQREIDQNLEMIEEAEETLVLGLNTSFINEIDEARNEAGLKIDGEALLPAR